MLVLSSPSRLASSEIRDRYCNFLIQTFTNNNKKKDHILFVVQKKGREKNLRNFDFLSFLDDTFFFQTKKKFS